MNMVYLRNSPFFEHLVKLLDVDVDQVRVGDDPVRLSVRLELIIIALGSHTFKFVISAIVLELIFFLSSDGMVLFMCFCTFTEINWYISKCKRV